MLLRLPHLPLTSAVTLIRPLPMSDVDDDVEILALRHQLDGVEPQPWVAGVPPRVGAGRVRFG